MRRNRHSFIRSLFEAGWFLLGLVLGLAIHGVAAVGSWLWRVLRAIRAAGPKIVCPRGCQQLADDHWRCRCGALQQAWVWAPCTACGDEPGYVACSRCGLAITNPNL